MLDLQETSHGHGQDMSRQQPKLRIEPGPIEPWGDGVGSIKHIKVDITGGFSVTPAFSKHLVLLGKGGFLELFDSVYSASFWGTLDTWHKWFSFHKRVQVELFFAKDDSDCFFFTSVNNIWCVPTINVCIIQRFLSESDWKQLKNRPLKKIKNLSDEAYGSPLALLEIILFIFKSVPLHVVIFGLKGQKPSVY